MIRRLIRKSMPLCCALPVLCLPMQLSGQPNAEAPAMDANGTTPVCMTRPMSRVAQVPEARRGQPFRIITIERGASALEKKGFRRVMCETADMVRADKKNSFRDDICELASFGNEAVQNQLERALGERPAVLCAGAEIVAGTWARKKQLRVVRKAK